MKEYVINGKKYRLNIFDKLDCKDAYLIGYLAGDGAFSKKTHKKHAKLTISSSNENVIKFIKKNYCPDSTYRSIIPINNKRNIISKKLSHILPLSSKFSETFKKYGILCLKKDRTFINISRKMFMYYLRGLIDADGNISTGIRKDRDRLWFKFQITHQSIKLLKAVQNLLNIEYNISTVITKRKDEDCFDLTISNRESLLVLYKNIIDCNNTPFFKRKNLKYFYKMHCLMPPKRVKTGNVQ